MESSLFSSDSGSGNGRETMTAELGRAAQKIDESTPDHTPTLTDDEINQLEKRGITNPQHIGSGATKDTYRAEYRSGDVTRSIILKRERNVDPEESVTTAINTSRKDLHKSEIRFGNEVNHPNIEDLLDNFEINGTRFLSCREYWARDLDSHIEEFGPITDEQRRFKIASQLLEAGSYFHRKGILHGDIKPDNTLITPEDQPILIDWQNAARASDTTAETVQTKGSTPYTTPAQLNALVTRWSHDRSPRDDMYALGATFYYMLTGEQAFDYRLDSDENGKSLEVGDRTFNVQLKRDDSPIEFISDKDKKQDIKRIKRRMKQKKVPKRWRKLVTNLIDPKRGTNNIGDVKDWFYRVHSPWRVNIVESLKSSIPKLTVGALTGALAGGLVLTGIYGIKKEPTPKLEQLLSQPAYQTYSMQDIADRVSPQGLHPIVKALEHAKEKVSENRYSFFQPESLEKFLEEGYMDKRLGSSLLRATQIIENENYSTSWKTKDKNLSAKQLFERDGEQRVVPGYVPASFITETINPQIRQEGYNPDEAMEGVKLGAAMKYLKLSISGDTDKDGKHDVLDTLLSYFSNQTDIATAKARAYKMNVRPMPLDPEKNLSFFGEADGITGTSMGNEEGWGKYLPRHQRDLIYTSLGLYQITDEQGKIHWDRIPKLKITMARTEYMERVVLPEDGKE